MAQGAEKLCQSKVAGWVVLVPAGVGSSVHNVLEVNRVTWPGALGEENVDVC